MEKAKDEAKRTELLKSYEKLPAKEQFLRFDSVSLKAIEVDFESGKILREVNLFERESAGAYPRTQHVCVADAGFRSEKWPAVLPLWDVRDRVH